MNILGKGENDELGTEQVASKNRAAVWTYLMKGYRYDAQSKHET